MNVGKHKSQRRELSVTPRFHYATDPAKRLECAVFRRYCLPLYNNGDNGEIQSAGIQRTPNASRDAIAILPGRSLPEISAAVKSCTL